MPSLSLPLSQQKITELGVGYEVSSGKVFADFMEYTGQIPSATSSPDGRLLATVGNDSTIKVWTIPAEWRKKEKEARTPARQKK